MALWDDVVGPKGYHLYKEHAGSALGIPIPTSGRLADLFALDTDYILELYVPGEKGAPIFKSAVAFPYAPESMQISRDAATQITPTLGYLPIREHSLTRQLSIRMRGRSGVTPRQGHDREGAIITGSGPKILQEFDAFLDSYQRICHDHAVFYRLPATSSSVDKVSSIGGPYLVFRSFSNGIHVRVEPQNWTLTKDVRQSRFGYTWFLDLRAYAPADPTNPPRLFGKIQDAFVFVAELLNAASSVVSLAGTAVDRATELANSGRAVLQAAATAAATFGDVMSSVNDLQNVPRGYASDLANILTEAQNAVSGFHDSQVASQAFSDPSSASAPSTADEILEIENMLAELTKAAISAMTVSGVLGGRVSGAPAGVLVSAGVSTGALAVSDIPTDRYRRRPGPYATFDLPPEITPVGITVPLPDYGSLESLAQRYYDTKSLWRRISAANKMRGAYTLADGSPLVPGTMLLVPLTSTQLDAARVSPTQDVVGDPMAHDVFLDPVTGDLEISGSTTDIRTIRGAPNLEQAIRMRLLSTQGSSSPFPGWGLPELVGAGLTGTTAGFFASHLNQQLARDPRILEVTRVAIADEGGTLTALVECQPIQGQSLEVVAPI